MIVIADTTPIISLLKIKRLDILHHLFGEVIIPQAVYKELLVSENRNFSKKNRGSRLTSSFFLIICVCLKI